MTHNEITPFVRRALTSRLSKDNKIDVNKKIKSIDNRLFYIVSGHGNIIIEGESYPILPGSVILFRAGTQYVWEIEDITYHSVNFDYTDAYSHIKSSFHPVAEEFFDNKQLLENIHFTDVGALNTPIVIENCAEYEKDIRRIVVEFLIGGPFCEAMISSLLKGLILGIVRIYQSKDCLNDTKTAVLVRKIIDYISKNYSLDISNTSIAERFNFNPAYLSRVFKRFTGCPLHKFILDYRINTAAEMLKMQGAAIGEIAIECGFSSLCYFSKAFKQHTGLSPVEYRNSAGASPGKVLEKDD